MTKGLVCAIQRRMMKMMLGRRGAALFFIAFFFVLAGPLWAEEGEAVRVTVDKKSREAAFSRQEDGGFSLLFYSGASWHSLTFCRDAGSVLQKAAQSYAVQFEKHKLKKGKPSTMRAYGSLPVSLKWGSSAQSLDREAPSAADIGYVFDNNSPYFSILVQNAKNTRKQDTPALQESGQVLVLFTKSQLQGLLDAIFAR